MILFKFMLKSLLEKKVRILLVFFSIAASSALIFANEGFKRTIEFMIYEADSRYAGNSDLFIGVKQDVGAKEWINTELLKEFSEELEYICAIQNQYALYAPNTEDMYYFQVYGVNIEEFQKHNPFGIKEGDFKDWSNNRIIVGDVYATRYGFSINDTITLEMNGVEHDFTVAAIAKQEGIYSRELADGGKIFVPIKTLEAIYGGQSNQVYLKIKDPTKLENLYGRLAIIFSDYQVQYTLDTKLVNAEITNYVLPFRISTLVVILMTMFIIFSGYGLITTERISSLGTLRSLGVTKKKLSRLLLLESAGIGVIGGVFGCFFGICVLAFAKNIYFRDNGTFTNSVPLLFGIEEITITIVSSVIITCISAICIIRKTTKLQIKDIILYKREQRLTKKSKVWIVGTVLILACIILTPRLPNSIIGMVVGCMLAIGVLIGLVLILPGLIRLLAEVAGKLGFAHEYYLGIRNVSEDKALAGNLKLYSAMIAIVAYMVTIFHTMSYDLHYSWDHYNDYDISFNLRISDEDSLRRVKEVDGVTKAIGYYKSYDCTLGEDGLFINLFYGIEDSDFFNMNVVGGLDEVRTAVDSLNQEKNIITTNILKNKLGLKLGDILKIRYQDKEDEFTITGFVDTNLGIGHVAYISGANYKNFVGTTYYDCFNVRGDVNPNLLKLNLKRKFSKDILTINTKQELENANADKVDSIFKAISIYTYFAVGIGMLGMLNNIISGFLERKRSLALYHCIGMGNKGISKMLLTEAVTIGLLGSLAGLLAASFMMTTIPKVVSVMWGSVTVQPAYTSIAVLSITGLIAMLAISFLPLKSNRKISIMESMKYE